MLTAILISSIFDLMTRACDLAIATADHGGRDHARLRYRQNRNRPSSARGGQVGHRSKRDADIWAARVESARPAMMARLIQVMSARLRPACTSTGRWASLTVRWVGIAVVVWGSHDGRAWVLDRLYDSRRHVPRARGGCGHAEVARGPGSAVGRVMLAVTGTDRECPGSRAS
jgi:hypothetical protein